jgi:hypothetical protein
MSDLPVVGVTIVDAIRDSEAVEAFCVSIGR